MRSLFALLIGLTCAGAVTADVTVTGTAQIPYAPDRGTFFVNVSGEGDNVATALQKRDAVTKSLREALATAGMAAEDFKMTQSVGQRHGSYGAISGVKATNHIAIKIKDLDKMGPILDVLATKRAGVEMALELSSSKIAKLMNEARVAAIEDAKQKADLYAHSAGATLGTVVSITEVEQPNRSGRGGSVDTLEQVVSVELRVSFSLKPGPK